jgi:hypothetical protein
MEYAFWDSSSLVPLCVRQNATPAAEALSAQFRMMVWWAASVEMSSAFARLERMGQISAQEQARARARLEAFRHSWREVDPSDDLRTQAERLIEKFPLRAADSLQLAAALTWRLGRPHGKAFISGDAQLLEAARELGFKPIQA